MQRVHADFTGISEGRKALDRLKGMGYANAFLDVVDMFTYDFSRELITGGIENTSSLSAMVLKSSPYLHGMGKGPLVAADPMVSGMGPYDEITDRAIIRLYIKVESGNADEIKEILKDMGGIV